MSEAKLSQRLERVRGAAAIAAAAGGLLLSACSSESHEPVNDFERGQAFNHLIVLPGAEFRTEVSLAGNNAEHNVCHAEDQLLDISGTQQHYIRVGDESEAMNWVGLHTSELPENIREACADDPDGVVWLEHGTDFIFPTELTDQLQ